MREILFKGKCTNTGNWVYGCLVNNMFTYSEYSEFQKGEKVCEIITGLYESDNWEEAIQEKTNLVRVIPESVGQFTGLTDKNGTNIFEGDIIKFLLAPKELEWDSSENMFGTEPQVSWQECIKATEPILVSCELFFDSNNASYSLKNIKCYVLNENDEEYIIADPEEIGGGADGFETIINERYENWFDFAIDSILYDVWFNDFIDIEIIGNIHDNPELLK